MRPSSLCALLVLGVPSAAAAQPASLDCVRAQTICALYAQASTDDADSDGCTDLADVAPHDPYIACSAPAWCKDLECAPSGPRSAPAPSTVAPLIAAEWPGWVAVTSTVPLEIEAGQIVGPRHGRHQQLALTRTLHIPAHRPIQIRSLSIMVDRHPPDPGELYKLMPGRLTGARARILEAIDAEELLAELFPRPYAEWQPSPEGRAELIQHALWGEQIEREHLRIGAVGLPAQTFVQSQRSWAALRSRLPALAP